MLCKVGCEEICNSSMYFNTIMLMLLTVAVGYIIWDKFVYKPKLKQ